MFDLRSLRDFALRFIGLFILLLLPWPGFRPAFGAIFQWQCRVVLGLTLPTLTSFVENNADPVHPSVDTKITIARSNKSAADQESAVISMVMDSRSFGWMPNAMLIALMGATPAGWVRRRRIFWPGFLTVNAFVTATIWVNAAWAVFRGTPPAWRAAALFYSRHLLVENLWLAFLVPTLVWFGCVIWWAPLRGKAATCVPRLSMFPARTLSE